MGRGNVYWITGLSGAGKTTIGSLLYQRLKMKQKNIVFLDGDALRSVFGNDLGYTMPERSKGAYRNARLCKMLSDQGIDVICCTISMFDDVRRWNRDNIEQYIEIYLEVSLETLKKRDQKGLYSTLSEDVAGVDLEVDLPKNPDIVIVNDGDEAPATIVNRLLCRGVVEK